MGTESLSEIARQISPTLWDKPSLEGSDEIRVIHNDYMDKNNSPVVKLASVFIKPLNPEVENQLYIDKSPSTPYRPGSTYRLRIVFLNYNRKTITIAYEDVDEELQFDTWRTPSLEEERIKIRFRRIPQNNYR